MTIIDVHNHIFPDDVAIKYVENYKSLSNFGGLYPPTIESLTDSMASENILKCIVLTEWESTIPFESDNLKFIAKLPNNCYCYSFNKWLGEMQKNNPNLIGFGGVHPDEPDRVEEIERMVKSYGLKGLKLHTCMHQFRANDKRLWSVYEKAAKYKLPILFHTGLDPIPGMEKYGNPKDVGDVAQDFPELNLILGHFGAPFYDDSIEVLKKYENTYSDTAVFIDIVSPRKAKELISHCGVDRFMFGSDFPFYKPGDSIKHLQRIKLTEEEKLMILHKNAERVLKI